MRFKYVGVHDAVEIHGVGVVTQGQTVEFEPAVAEGLKGRADWEQVPDPKRSRAAKKAAATRAENDEESQA